MCDAHNRHRAHLGVGKAQEADCEQDTLNRHLSVVRESETDEAVVCQHGYVCCPSDESPLPCVRVAMLDAVQVEDGQAICSDQAAEGEDLVHLHSSHQRRPTLADNVDDCIHSIRHMRLFSSLATLGAPPTARMPYVLEVT